MIKFFDKLKFVAVIFIFYSLLIGAVSKEPYQDYKIGKNYYISKINDEFVLDGLIKEEFWNNIESVKRLIQAEPKFGEEPSEKTTRRPSRRKNLRKTIDDKQTRLKTQKMYKEKSKLSEKN